MFRPDRREFLKSAATGAALFPFAMPPARAAFDGRKKLPVAAVVTEYRPKSHADVIVGKILAGWSQDGGPGPDLELVSLYVDQFPESDMSRDLARKYGFRLAKTIDEAVTLGTDTVPVAGVLSIGEHGDYPETPDTHQRMYPRRRFFEGIAAAFRRGNKVVPVFNDKHLAWNWKDAKFMADTAKEMKIPFVAGSSVPFAWRFPQLELPRDTEIEAAVTIGYSDFESYGFHTLEAHQCMIERRKGGEGGLVSVQALTGEAILKSAAEGRWSRELFAAALAKFPGPPRDTGAWANEKSAVFLLEHRDGLKTAAVMANGLVEDFAFACKVKGRDEPLATWIKLQPGPPFGHFAYLLQGIEQTIHTAKPAWPLERTLLTTGALDRVMQSLAQKGKRLESPELAVAYTAADWPFANHPKATMTLSSD